VAAKFFILVQIPNLIIFQDPESVQYFSHPLILFP